MNYLVIFGTAAIPLLVGIIWYNNAFGFGKAWMTEIGKTEEELNRDFNPLKVFGFAYLFGLFLTIAFMPMTIHQMGFMSMLADQPSLKDPNSDLSKTVAGLMTTYGQEFRTFKHGALHGFMSSVFLALPVIAVSALFERRTWKYIFIHVGYWAITFAIMGGIVCQFLDISPF
jgi:Protein of unknown function (DUF1761)